jgi:hypothetical protein
LRRRGPIRLKPDPARHPYDHNSDSGGEDADETHPISWGLRCVRHRPPHGLGEGRKQKALDRESEAEGGDKVAHERRITAPRCR